MYHSDSGSYLLLSGKRILKGFKISLEYTLFYKKDFYA